MALSFDARAATPAAWPRWRPVACDGSAVSMLGTADFNGDEKDDLFGRTDNGVATFLSNGNGSFQPCRISGPKQWLEYGIVDMNGDRKLDVLFLSPGLPARVMLWYGVGDGTLAKGPEVEFPNRVEGWRVAELNGDGFPDLIVVSGIVTLFENSTTGFTVMRTISGFSSSDSIVLADTDQDGKLDLVVGGITVLRGDGRFGHVRLATQTYYANWFVDLSGDGLPERIRLTNLRRTVAIFSFTGSTTETTYEIGIDASTMEVRDANRDGVDDILVAGNRIAALLLGHPDGTFAPPVFYSSGWDGNLLFGDFDSDRIVDLIGTSSSTSKPIVSLIPGLGGGVFELPRAYSYAEANSLPTATAIGTGDLNGDGWLDVAAVNHQQGRTSVIVYRSDQLGGFSSPLGHVFAEGSESAGAPIAADLDGDGVQDLIVPLSGSFRYRLLYGNRAGNLRDGGVIQTGRIIAVADMLGDGGVELIADEFFESVVQIIQLASDGSARIVARWPRGGSPLKVADVTGDGRPDIVCFGTVVVNDGNGKAHMTPLGAFREVGLSTAGDFDADGKADIVALGQGSGGGLLWPRTLAVRAAEANGAMLPPRHLFGYRGDPLEPFGDFNGDGNLDFVGSDGLVAYGRGDWTFDAGAQLPPNANPAPDLDRDGRSDFLLTRPGFFVPVFARDIATGALPAEITITAAQATSTAAGVSFTVESATSDAAAPTGSVVFLAGGRVCGIATAGSGIASLLLMAGPNEIIADYRGDSNFAPARATFTLQVPRSEIYVDLFSRGLLGTMPLPFEATMIRGGGFDPIPRTGTMSLIDATANTVLTTVDLASLPAGTASVILTANLKPDVPHLLEARYSGDENHLPAESQAYNFNVLDLPVSIERSTLSYLPGLESKIVFRALDAEGKPLITPNYAGHLVELHSSSRGWLFVSRVSSSEYTARAPSPLDQMETITATINRVPVKTLVLGAPRRRAAAPH